jgi:hypothetical protein
MAGRLVEFRCSAGWIDDGVVAQSTQELSDHPCGPGESLKSSITSSVSAIEFDAANIWINSAP